MKKKIFYVVSIALGFAACNESINDVVEIENLQNESTSVEEQGFVLGKKLDNPYSLSTMRAAYKQLKGLSKSCPANDDFIQATHLYIKFSPKDEEEYDLLTSDTTLDVYPYPLDYEIISYEGNYHDPELPDTVPTFQYASVPYGHEFPKIDYEVLDSLYIPFEGKDDEDNKLSKSKVVNIWDELEYKALEITDNLSEDEKQQSISKKKKSWRPGGAIYLSDDKQGTIPLQGVKVRARRMFTTHRGITDATGKYSCDGTFKYKANYYIKWDRADFKIKDGWASEAKYDGPKKDDWWTVTINSTAQKNYASAFRAAYYYYYCQNVLPKPPSCNIRVYQWTQYHKNGNFSSGRKISPFSNAIHVYYNNRPTNEIFGTTIHELTHAMHWNWSNCYNGTESKLKETWATGVAYYFSNQVYGFYDYNYKGNYTGVVEDLIVDCGFNISYIGTAAMTAKTLNGFKQYIKSSYYGKIHEKEIDSVFTRWN